MILHGILGVRGCTGFRPEVSRIGGAASQFQRDQVILLIQSRAVRETVLPHLAPLQRSTVAEGRPHGRGVASHTDGLMDVRLGHAGIDRAGRADGVRQTISADASVGLVTGGEAEREEQEPELVGV
jgi:hypothetical protein